MSKPDNRGSLMGLKSSFPSLSKVAPVSLTTEMEERILGTETSKSLPTDSGKDVNVQAAEPTPAPYNPPESAMRKKEPSVLMNAKLPVRLHARLKRTAQFNDISMTDILIRAIEAELATGRYAAPPETWGSEIK